MAIAAVAGLAAAGSASLAAGALTVFGLSGFAAYAAVFAIGAGLSMVSTALMPKPSYGQQMTGTDITVREPDASRKMVYGRTRMGGAIVYIDSTGTDNEYIHLVIALAGHEIDAFEEIYFNNEKIWDGGSFVGSWGTYVYLGLHDGSQTTADSALVSASTQWTNNHKLLDVAYMYVRLKYDAEQFAQGLPNVSAVIRGKKVYNPVTAVTEWTQNPALCVYDYLRDTKYGLAESASDVNSAALATAITLCDQAITLSAGGTQPRYTLDGLIDTANSKKDNIEGMLTAMAGSLSYSGGEYFISGAAYVTPTVTIDESVMVGGIEVQTKQSRRSLYNGVKGVFRSEEDDYVVADYPAQLSSTFSTEDGDPIYLDLALPFTTNNVRAQRIAKLALLRSRQQTAISVPCNLSALKFKAGDNIMVTNAKMGWSAKVFQVTGYDLSLSGGGEIIVSVQAIETASAIYDWAASDQEDYLAGGEVSLYNGSTVAAPTSFAGTASTEVNLDGTVAPQIVSTWVSSADAFVVNYDYQWSTDNSNWNSFDVEGNQFTISPTIGAATYYTRVRAVNNLGVRSSFVTANVTAIGDTVAPAVAGSPSATAGQGSITVAWLNPSDKDFSNVEVHRSTSSGGTYTVIASVSGGFGLAGSFVNGSLSDSTAYYYKLKSVDYSGNKSAFTGVVNATTSAAAQTPRANQGYVYKTAASAGTPSTPSATSYNYDTGSFGGLTSGWQVDPPTVTGADGKYWATSFSVTESAYGGLQTITFNTPFSSYNFDGLVTFTNLNSELANASSTEITTINGGLLKTGTIEADRVRIDGVGIDVVTSGSEKTLIIGDDGVTTVKINDLAVTQGKIANLAVDTLQIAGNAVNVIRTATSTGDIDVNGSSSGSWTTIGTLSFTPESVEGVAQPISLKSFLTWTSIVGSNLYVGSFSVRVKRGSDVLIEYLAAVFIPAGVLGGSGAYYLGTPIGSSTPIIIDTSTSVSGRTYTLEAKLVSTATNSPKWVVPAGATLEAVEVKR